MAELSSETRFLHAIEMGLGPGSEIMSGNLGTATAMWKSPGVSSLIGRRNPLCRILPKFMERSIRAIARQFLKETDQPVLIANFLPFPGGLEKAPAARLKQVSALA
jgi:hypothetical protein